MNVSNSFEIRAILPKYCQLIKRELNYEFKNEDFLLVSIIHSSVKNEFEDIVNVDNERLEFLGDSVLDLIVSNFLFFLPDYGKDEGKLTVSRSKIVNQKSLADFALELSLDKYLVTAKSGNNIDIASNESVLSDVFEALVGALFLDAGYERAEEAILYRFEEEFYKILEQDNKNYKSILSEFLDKAGKNSATYQLVSTSGPDHDKTFESIVLISNIEYGRGIGKTKKKAEALAAKQALEKLKKCHIR